MQPRAKPFRVSRKFLKKRVAFFVFQIFRIKISWCLGTFRKVCSFFLLHRCRRHLFRTFCRTPFFFRPLGLAALPLALLQFPAYHGLFPQNVSRCSPSSNNYLSPSYRRTKRPAHANQYHFRWAEKLHGKSRNSRLGNGGRRTGPCSRRAALAIIWPQYPSFRVSLVSARTYRRQTHPALVWR